MKLLDVDVPLYAHDASSALHVRCRDGLVRAPDPTEDAVHDG